MLPCVEIEMFIATVEHGFFVERGGKRLKFLRVAALGAANHDRVDRVLEITPNDPELMAAKAQTYQAQGNLEQAAKFLLQINAGGRLSCNVIGAWPLFCSLIFNRTDKVDFRKMQYLP